MNARGACMALLHALTQCFSFFGVWAKAVEAKTIAMSTASALFTDFVLVTSFSLLHVLLFHHPIGILADRAVRAHERLGGFRITL